MAEGEMSQGYLLACVDTAIAVAAEVEAALSSGGEDDDPLLREIEAKAPGDVCEHGGVHPVGDPKGDSCWSAIQLEYALVYPNPEAATREVLKVLRAIRIVVGSMPADHIYRFERPVS
jgi:hypothetical protein